jgi:hypothetical protein
VEFDEYKTASPSYPATPLLNANDLNQCRPTGSPLVEKAESGGRHVNSIDQAARSCDADGIHRLRILQEH